MGMENNASDDATEQLRRLEARVRSWKKWVSGIAVCLIGAYLIYFGLILGQNPATDSDKWGAFGDFIGGVLNPIVAFAAFFWLTESVKIQKQELADTRLELAETRRELGNSAIAQAELVKNGRASVRLAALTSLLNANNTKIDLLNQKVNRLEIEIAADRARREKNPNKHTLAAIAEDIKLTPDQKSRNQLLEEIKVLEIRSDELQSQIEDQM